MTPGASGPAEVAAGTLYIVPVPIGNLKDITYRAVDTLRAVELIAAEDTRHLEKLRRAYQIGTPAISYHEFNEQRRTDELVARLLRGQSVALVSDAGTPLVSDPGFLLVRAALAGGISVVSLPGACAAVTALAASGLPPSAFRFIGFPTRTGGKRRALFASLRHERATLVLYEAPHRLVAMLEDLRAELGERRVCVARNLTKSDESYLRGTVGEVLAALGREAKVRGQATIVVAGWDDTQPAEGDTAGAAKTTASDLLDDGLETREVAERLAALHGLARREAYRVALEARREREDEGTDE